ncbi:MAG: hypothetical protein ACLFVB_07580 [Thermoplasmata archaeon]
MTDKFYSTAVDNEENIDVRTTDELLYAMHSKGNLKWKFGDDENGSGKII